MFFWTHLNASRSGKFHKSDTSVKQHISERVLTIVQPQIPDPSFLDLLSREETERAQAVIERDIDDGLAELERACNKGSPVVLRGRATCEATTVDPLIVIRQAYVYWHRDERETYNKDGKLAGGCCRTWLDHVDSETCSMRERFI